MRYFKWKLDLVSDILWAIVGAELKSLYVKVRIDTMSSPPARIRPHPDGLPPASAKVIPECPHKELIQAAPTTIYPLSFYKVEKLYWQSRNYLYIKIICFRFVLLIIALFQYQLGNFHTSTDVIANFNRDSSWGLSKGLSFIFEIYLGWCQMRNFDVRLF